MMAKTGQSACTSHAGLVHGLLQAMHKSVAIGTLKVCYQYGKEAEKVIHGSQATRMDGKASVLSA